MVNYNLVTGVYGNMVPVATDTPPQADHTFNYNFTGTGAPLNISFTGFFNNQHAYHDNCGGLYYTITVAPTTYSYVWDFGDNSPTVTTTSDTPPAHTYTTAGTYNVTCTATPVSENNNSNCSITSSMPVTINPQPTISISGPTSVYENGTVTLTATSNATNIVWGDGTIGNTLTNVGVGTYSAIATDVITQCGSDATLFDVALNTFTIDKAQLLGTIETLGGYTYQTITYTITLTNDSENSETYNITDDLPSTFIIDTPPSGLTLANDLSGTVTMAPNTTQTFTYTGSYLVTGNDQTQSVAQEPNIACATNTVSGIQKCDQTVIYISFGCPGNLSISAANAQSTDNPQQLTMWYNCHKPFNNVTQIKFKVHYPNFLRVAPVQTGNWGVINTGTLESPVNAETPSQTGYNSVEITANFSGLGVNIGVAIQNVFNIKFEVINNATLATLPKNTYDLFVETLSDGTSNMVDMTKSGSPDKILTQIGVLEILNGPWANLPTADFTYVVNPCNHKVSVSATETGGYNRWEFNDPNNPFVPIWGDATYTWQYQNSGTYTITHFYINQDGIGASNTKTIVMNAVNYDYPNGINITSNGQNIQDLNGDGQIKVAGPINVQSGLNYLINNKTIQFVDDLIPNIPDLGQTHSGIIVNTNATLIIRNSTLKGINECPSMWQGIQVYGYVPPKNPGGPTVNIPNGKVILQNNSVIKDAEIGVALYRVNRPFGNTLEYGSGILDASNSTFTNNRISVAFQGRNYVANSSTITECTFRCNNLLKDQIKYNQQGSDVFILASKVKNVIIKANSFFGNLSLAYHKRGTGIRSYDAAYQVISGTPQNVSNTFSNLSAGIDIYSTGGANKIIRIKNNRFNNTFQGITANGSSFDEISFNIFTVPSGIIDYPSWGMNLQSSYGFLATENVFNTSQTSNYTYGLISKNTNLANGKAYKNTFNGNFYAATQAEQNNSLLQIKCNKYLGINTYDWTITSGVLANQGACNASATSPAGNTFGSCNSANSSQIFKAATVPSFEYRTQASLMPNCISANVNLFPCTTPYIPNNSCPTQVALPCNNCYTQLLNDFNLTPNGANKIAKKNALINVLNNEEQGQVLRQVLSTSEETTDFNILIPTLIEDEEYAEARMQLSNFQRTDNEKEQFFRFYDILTNLGETNRSRREITALEKQVIAEISAASVLVSIHAESLLLDIMQSSVSRIPENVQLSSGMRLANNSSNETEETEIIAESRFIVYPNPSEGEINVKFSKESTGNITIIDALGRIQFEAQLLEDNYKEFKTHLNNGIYILKHTDVNGLVETKQIVINH